jgi:uncharacterized SAM-binding protein YcdF (DUF218 family)
VPGYTCAAPAWLVTTADTVRLDTTALMSFVPLLLLPPVLPLLLASVGLLLVWRRWRGGLAIAVLGVALAWFFSMPVVAQGLLHLLERDLTPLTPERWAAARNTTRPPKAVVVLGGGVAHDLREYPHPERVHPRTLERVVNGARVTRMTGLPVLLSGGVPPDRNVSEAELMRRVLEGDLGVRARWLEQRSRDTAGNAVQSAAILKAADIDSIVLVTQAYHMPRAKAAFEAAGLSVLAAPHHFLGGPAGTAFRDWLPGTQAAADGRLALHEWAGLWWYRLRRLA